MVIDDISNWVGDAYDSKGGIEGSQRYIDNFIKEGENLPKIEMKQRSAFLYFGSHQRNHVHLAHPSISRRHAAIFANNLS